MCSLYGCLRHLQRVKNCTCNLGNPHREPSFLKEQYPDIVSSKILRYDRNAFRRNIVLVTLKAILGQFVKKKH